METITCLLTIHNKENMLESVIQGIITNISDNVIEIILVFDGCTDKSESIAESIFNKSTFKGRVTKLYTDDVFELKANNHGLRYTTTDYVILIQDDMIIRERYFDQRMIKPFLAFDDVFAVTSQTAHNNRIIDNSVITVDSADRRLGYPRDKFGIREIANRGPLMYKVSDLSKLNFLDESFSPNSFDDHDISYRAFKELGKVSGLYWIHYDSDPSWGTGRQKNQHIHEAAHIRNSQLIVERHADIIGKIKNEDRELI